MQREIGSNFDLNPEIIFNNDSKINLKMMGLEGEDTVFLSTGRSAEGLILDEIEKRNPQLKKIALIPPFTCHTVMEPFLKRGYRITAYSIDRSFNLDPEIFREEMLQSGAQVILLHSYFGFNTVRGMESIIKEGSEKGITFIEDRTQCLYSGFSVLPVDYFTGSLRKWAALPDGGYAVCRQGKFHDRPQDYDRELEKEKLTAARWKYKYLHENQGNKEHFLEKFRGAEEILNTQKKMYQISPSSEYLQSQLDIESLKRKRRENYAQLYDELCDLQGLHIITPELKEKEVPLYCPVRVKNREKLQKFLSFHRIYAPVVWPKATICPPVCSEAEELYQTMLCLPIDQRYDADDMERLVRCIREYEKKYANS